MSYYIDIQNAATNPLPLSDSQITALVTLALRDHKPTAELTIRLVDATEMIHLNHTYRQQNKTTNVLAFPSTIPAIVELESPFLGDVIICPQVLVTESEQLKKSLEAHWSLILIHGVLHLLGYDHIEENDAKIMQAIEIRLLAEIGYDNPYDNEDEHLE